VFSRFSSQAQIGLVEATNEATGRIDPGGAFIALVLACIDAAMRDDAGILQSFTAMLADLARLDAGARARWAVEEPERRVQDIACPSCNAYSLVVTPVRVVGGQEQVTCSRISCGRVLSSQDWERLRAWSVLVARMSAKTEETSA